MNLFIKLAGENVDKSEVFKIRVTNVDGWGTQIDMVDKTGNAYQSYQIKGTGYAEIENDGYSD